MMDALIPPEAASVPALPPSAPVFRPTPKHRAYALVLFDAMESGKPVSHRALAPEAGSDRETIAKWYRDPGFVGWLNAELEAGQATLRNLCIGRAQYHALQGSPKRLDWLARVFGWYRSHQPMGPLGDPDGELVPGVGRGTYAPTIVNILVPRPED